MMLSIVALLVIGLSGQDAASLDLDALRQPQADAGLAAQTAAIYAQVPPNWRVHCDTPEMATMTVKIDITLDRTGRLVGSVRPVRDQENTPAFLASVAGASYALQRSSPFAMPADFEGGRYRVVFDAARACSNH